MCDVCKFVLFPFHHNTEAKELTDLRALFYELPGREVPCRAGCEPWRVRRHVLIGANGDAIGWNAELVGERVFAVF